MLLTRDMALAAFAEILLLIWSRQTLKRPKSLVGGRWERAMALCKGGMHERNCGETEFLRA